MSWKLVAIALALALLGGCGSQGSEAEQEGENADAPAAQTVSAFYDAADRSAGPEACALLTARGIQQIVHVKSRAACVTTINAFAPGSFSNKEGDLLHVEGVEEDGDNAFAVDAQLEGRSGGTYTVAKRHGQLLLDGFASDEG
jgi:hypothetical protein